MVKRHSSGIKTHRRRPSQKNWPNTFNHPSSTFRVLETKFVPLKFYKRKPEVFNILRQILRLRLYHRRKSCKKTLPLRLRISISLHLRWICEHHLQLHLRVNLHLTCEPGYMIYLVTLFVRIIIIVIVIIISL